MINNFIFIKKDLREDMRNFEIWLKNVELIIENLFLNPNWDLNEIEKNLNNHKVTIILL
jgi:hypothetical protein